MNFPLGGDQRIEISATTLGHWATVALGAFFAIVTYAYHVEITDLHKDDADLQKTISDQAASIEAIRLEQIHHDKQITNNETTGHAHEIDDARREAVLSNVQITQGQVLARLAVIEAHDVATTSSFDRFGKQIDDLNTAISQRIDGINRELAEVQRQIAAIEGKLGESLPDPSQKQNR